MFDLKILPKKVCHLTSAHARYDTRIFHKECKSLALNGFDVTLIVNDDLPDEKIDGVRIISTCFKPKNRIDRFLKFKKIMHDKIEKIDADLYHLHDPELLIFAKWLKKQGKIVIFDSHEVYPVQIKHKKYIPRPLRHVVSRLYYYYETSVVSYINAVIFPCKINGMHPFDNRTKRAVTIDNYPIIERNKKTNRNFIADSICYAGGLSHSRGITNLIKAAYKANVKLFLAGRFESDKYYDELTNMKEFENVKYLGLLNNNEIRDLYQKSNIGMATLLNIGQYNTSENFPTKVYEYMLAEMPVIISKSAYTNKVLNKYKFGISVDPHNIEEIAKAIKYLVYNSGKAIEMGKIGRKLVETKFNWKNEEIKLVKLYSDLLYK